MSEPIMREPIMPEPMADRYRRFAETEAAGVAPLYEALARAVADSPSVLEFLAQLPKHRQQPNLFLAALRLVAGRVIAPRDLEDIVSERGAEIADIMRTRSTQTNEPARCATLLPALGQIDGPLAIIEVGASAGLCLLPDAYGYDWGRQTLAPPTSDAPIFSCRACGNAPLPRRHPEIVWRAGLDLNPLSIAAPADVAWLETLVWPGQDARLARLRDAIKIAQTRAPLRIETGDLTRDLAALMDEAPRDATLVVFHTAVLTYVSDQAARDRFAQEMLNSRAHWLSNEGIRVFPQFAGHTTGRTADKFLLMENARPIARTGPHGQSLDWIAQDP